MNDNVKRHLRGARRVLINYTIGFAIFLFFSYFFYNHLKVFSFFVFLFTVLILYIDVNKTAVEERTYPGRMKPYPLKGLVIGVLGMLPILVIVFIAPFFNFNLGGINFEVLKRFALYALFGPMFFIVKMTSQSVWAYMAIWFIIPVTSMIGYLTGYFGIELGKVFAKKGESK